MKKSSLFFILVLTANFCLSQEKSSEKGKDLVALNQKLEGTYQLQMINTRLLPAVPLQLIETIEQKRQENEITYFDYTDKIRVMVLSRKAITAPGFKPLEKIAFVRE